MDLSTILYSAIRLYVTACGPSSLWNSGKPLLDGKWALAQGSTFSKWVGSNCHSKGCDTQAVSYIRVKSPTGGPRVSSQ